MWRLGGGNNGNRKKVVEEVGEEVKEVVEEEVEEVMVKEVNV